jgi:cell division protease FtsH
MGNNGNGAGAKTNHAVAARREGLFIAGDSKPAAKHGFVNVVLPPPLTRLARTLQCATLGDAAHRTACVFFQGEPASTDERSPGELKTDLLLECLPRFIASLGGFIVHGVEFNRDNAVPLELKHVEVDGDSRPILQSGQLFIEGPNERATVSLRRNYIGSDERICELFVSSSADASRFLADWETYARQHNYLKGRACFPDGTVWARHRRYSWDDIVLPPGILETIQRQTADFLKNRATLRKLGIKPRRGLMLEGEPGTGKTLLCKILADQLDASFMWITPRHVRSVDLFARHLDVARFIAPTVIFLEDIDLYAEEREAGKSVILGELMGQLDGVTENEDIITIASTNRLHVVEKALRNRPGRFDRIVHIGPLDESCRRRLLDRLMVNASMSESDRAMLASVTHGYTGAQLEELANTIYMLAVSAHGVGGNGDQLRVDRALIERALCDVGVERKHTIGYR